MQGRGNTSENAGKARKENASKKGKRSNTYDVSKQFLFKFRASRGLADSLRFAALVADSLRFAALARSRLLKQAERETDAKAKQTHSNKRKT